MRKAEMRVYKTVPPGLTYEERHPYLVTLPRGEMMRFTNWPLAIETAVERGKGQATVTYKFRTIPATKEFVNFREFPETAAV